MKTKVFLVTDRHMYIDTQTRICMQNSMGLVLLLQDCSISVVDEEIRPHHHQNRLAIHQPCATVATYVPPRPRFTSLIRLSSFP